MENVYDIRAKDKLLYILPDEYSIYSPAEDVSSSVAIAVNLYYEDTVERYFEYLTKSCLKFPIFIISSKQVILDRANDWFGGNSNVRYIAKENRGRDVSALLVSFRETARKYKYICFIHDKKSKHNFLEEDVDNWAANLWDNVIASEEYINNILQIFEENENMGMLAPPEPLGKYFEAWYGNAWANIYGDTERVCKELNVVNCDLNREKYPITLGTVFWARTESLQKILLKEWTYEDFPEEPMPVDRTINHAIERIWGYVVQDAGYKTGTVMTASYAEWSLLFVQQEMRKMYHILRDEMGIQTLHQMDCLEEQESRIRDYFFKNEKVYLYGAGVYGRGLLKRIRQWGLTPSGFLVGSGKRNETCIDGLKVYELGEISVTENPGIIIAVNYNLQYEIEEALKAAGVSNFMEGYV